MLIRWKQPRVNWEASWLTHLVRLAEDLLPSHAAKSAAVMSARLMRSTAIWPRSDEKARKYRSAAIICSGWAKTGGR
jgi:hypothetical protein